MGGHHSWGTPGTSTATDGADHRRRLRLVLTVTATVMVAEVVGALVSGSLALAADAGHMFTDVAGIAIALTAMTIADRASASRSTFGLYRLEIFAAAVNAVILLAVAAAVAWSAVRRLNDPPDVDSTVMLVVAVVGLGANGWSLWWLHDAQDKSLNVRGAYLEVLGDLLGSIAVIAAGAVIAVTGAAIADPITSLVVAVLIVPRTWLLLREAVTVLLEVTPTGTDLDHVRNHILEVTGVVELHDLHVWTISSGRPVMSAHVVVDEAWLHRSGEVLDSLQGCLAAHFDVGHCTFQVEPRGHSAHESGLHP
ncbi:MAG: cation diffusion facilitator family transporter [Nocardioidaceae bacterium]